MTIKLDEKALELSQKLTDLERKISLYLMCNSTSSHREAYLASGGKAKTEKAQDVSTAQILGKVRVKAFRDHLKALAITDAVMTREEALARLSKSAKITMKDVCDFRNVEIGNDEDGEPVFKTVWTIKNAEDIPDHIAACIKSVTSTKTGPKIEIYDSNGAIKQLSDMQGWDAPKKIEGTFKLGGMSDQELDDELNDLEKQGAD